MADSPSFLPYADDHHGRYPLPRSSIQPITSAARRITKLSSIVKLEEVAVTTEEEDEDAILDLKAKLFDKDGNQWKERGTGTVKLLKHKESGKVRHVMRQTKTLKIYANHLVLPTMSVQEHAGNDKSCAWHTADFADGELKDEFFCIRFASIELRYVVDPGHVIDYHPLVVQEDASYTELPASIVDQKEKVLRNCTIPYVKVH
ncbi:ran-binding protein 1 homolog c-like [Diospyros lotus]|uniref:ran-binding protein 1 homolog c-like n=1 Tax=Diospyros lotus TaxID=55363 RepID=UPI00224D9B5A|nr:ran-binding protein 1 homolog c-like [Diospyros lotus]